MRPRTAAIRAYVAAALRPAARRLLAAAFLVDFAFVFVFIVAMQDFLTGQRYRGLYLPALALSAYGAGKLAVQVAAGRLVDRLGWTQAAKLSLAGILAAQLLLLAATASRPLLLPAFAHLRGVQRTVLAGPLRRHLWRYRVRRSRPAHLGPDPR